MIPVAASNVSSRVGHRAAHRKGSQGSTCRKHNIPCTSHSVSNSCPVPSAGRESAATINPAIFSFDIDRNSFIFVACESFSEIDRACYLDVLGRLVFVFFFQSVVGSVGVFLCVVCLVWFFCSFRCCGGGALLRGQKKIFVFVFFCLHFCPPPHLACAPID